MFLFKGQSFDIQNTTGLENLIIFLVMFFQDLSKEEFISDFYALRNAVINIITKI